MKGLRYWGSPISSKMQSGARHAERQAVGSWVSIGKIQFWNGPNLAKVDQKGTEAT